MRIFKNVCLNPAFPWNFYLIQSLPLACIKFSGLHFSAKMVILFHRLPLGGLSLFRYAGIILAFPFGESGAQRRERIKKLLQKNFPDCRKSNRENRRAVSCRSRFGGVTLRFRGVLRAFSIHPASFVVVPADAPPVKRERRIFCSDTKTAWQAAKKRKPVRHKTDSRRKISVS